MDFSFASLPINLQEDIKIMICQVYPVCNESRVRRLLDAVHMMGLDFSELPAPLQKRVQSIAENLAEDT